MKQKMDLEEIPSIVRGDKISEETKILISSLPSDADGRGNKLCKYQGCWHFYNTLQGVLNFQRGFQPQDSDIILASFPKSGTTWLKALTVALIERSKHPSSSDDDDHPLLSDNPHGIVPVIEMEMYIDSSSPKFSSSFPLRLFSTHMPLHNMQETLKDSPCKIVYICRNAKDMLISWWFFMCAVRKIEPNRCILESLYNSFCTGSICYGPFWEHVLSYWRGSLEDPKRILFLRYEEMKAEPRDQIKRLADFLGCSFTKEEEESGSVVDEILDLCSLRNLRGLEVNKTKQTYNIDHKNFFRKGQVGDWKNYLTPEMANKIDMIIQEKLQGSGLKF